MELIYAFEALRAELEKIESLQFIFTSPTFIPNEVTDSGKKVAREYFIPKAERERNVYGTEFEIQLKNKLTQRAIAKECAGWMRRKAQFRSNRTKAPMQQFACVSDSPADTSQLMLRGLFDNTKPDRTGEDMLFQVLLDCGVDPGLPIKSQKIDGCEVFIVNDSDQCFASDVCKINVEQILNNYPPTPN